MSQRTHVEARVHLSTGYRTHRAATPSSAIVSPRQPREAIIVIGVSYPWPGR